MRKAITETRIEAMPQTMGALELIVREGARKMLQAALEAEIEEHLSRRCSLVTVRRRAVGHARRRWLWSTSSVGKGNRVGGG